MNESASKKAATKGYGRDQVIKIINSVINKVGDTGDVSRETIFKELNNLQSIIQEARRDVGAMKPMDIKDKHIPVATDELDAVIQATAGATGAIMDCCEVIESKASALTGPEGAEICGEVTKIYEACSFQDITGQRIKKVVTTLRTIEDKVSRLMEIIGDRLPGIEDTGSGGDEKPTGDKALLNGPQMPDKAITQADIDKLLSQFD